MTLKTEFVELPLERLYSQVAIMKGDGWRFIQTHAVNTDDGVDLYYSFMKDDLARNYRVKGVQKGTPVPSITGLFLAAFVFENEARELFGVDMRDIAIDFGGLMYAPAEREPMTIMTPEQKAAREKARKAAESKPEEPKGEPASGAKPKRVFVMTPERQARIDAKLATMSPDKVAKVKAALEARAAEAAGAGSGAEGDAEKPAVADKAPAKAEQAPAEVEQPDVDPVLEAKIAALDPEKAAKVRAPLGGEAEVEEKQEEETAVPDDAQLSEKIALMDPEKAAKVRAALAASKGGE